jgi:hypothetical protein
MTARLYDRRMAVYPGLFAATEAFRMSRLDGTQDVRAHVRDGLTQVEQWGALEGALILSDVAYARFLELRVAARRLIQDADDKEHLQERKQDLWNCNNRLRSAIRADLGLMFDEDQPANA